MTTTEILSNLCAYDSRNPVKTEDRKLNIKGPCYCDNCFYGRTKMAKEILELRKLNLDLMKKMNDDNRFTPINITKT